MQVILVDDVFELGKRGEVVKVSTGFGRNYLIPQKLAIPATAGNLKAIEQQRLAMARKETKDKEEAQLLAQQLSDKHLVISRKAGDTGVLFGSVTSKDLGDVLESNGFHFDRRKILLPQPIKSIGNFRVETRPHSEVKIDLLVSVLAEGDEPIARVLPRGEESDQIVRDLQAKLGGLQAPAAVAVGAAEDAFESPAPKQEIPPETVTPETAEESERE